nr:hypothetical protein [Tanacetum cinerariifolium]
MKKARKFKAGDVPIFHGPTRAYFYGPDAITPILPTEEHEYSLSLGYEHLSTILETESNEVIEYSAKNLLPIPSEYEVASDDKSKCDVPIKDESSSVFTTFSNLLFNDNDDFTSSDDESLSNEDVMIEEFKVYSNPLFDDEEINSNKLDPHCFNAESDFVESLPNRDTLIDFSSKFDFLEEFSENSSNSIAPVLPTEEPEYSLSMGDEHLGTISETESDEVIKSSVKNLVPIPSESEVTSDNESECDVPVNDESSPIFTTFSNIIFDCNDDFTSSDDESLSNEDVPMENFKIYSNPLFDDEEIISTKIDPHYFNAESDLIESFLNQDILINSSPKFDYLLKEFSGELAHIDLIPPRIEEADFDLEE